MPDVDDGADTAIIEWARRCGDEKDAGSPMGPMRLTADDDADDAERGDAM
jgi:hypothetical protein